MRARALAALSTAAATAALITTGGTLAAFSDTQTVEGNRISAATVVIGAGTGDAPDLTFDGLLPGTSVTDELQVRYTGTIPADVYLDVDPSGSAFCDGSGGALAGGSVELHVTGSDWLPYCSLTGTSDLLLRGAAAPGAEFTAELEARLAAGTDHRYSQRTSSDPVVLRAVQAGGGPFTDRATATIGLSTGPIAPTVPAECGPASRYERVVVLPEGRHDWDAVQELGHGGGPVVVIGTGGDDTIMGSNKDDCLVGGDGDDVLDGREGQDVLLGGNGNDRLLGGNAKDQLHGGPGDDHLGGGNGKDELSGGPGIDAYVPDSSPPDDVTTCETELRPGGRPEPRAAEPRTAPAPAPVDDGPQATHG